MNRTKRKLSLKDSSDETRKKFRKNNNYCTNELIQSINSIENLSNEIFLKIFDYIDGCQIYESFSNLNHRFDTMLNCSLLLFKLKDYITIKDDGFINNWNQLMSYHKEQILCLTFYKSHRIKQFASTIESSFIHLQSLTLYHVESDTIIPVLMNLPSLSRLKSLVIEMFNIPIPRSNSPAWKRSVPSSSVDFVEAVFRLEIFPVISDQFLPESTGTLAGIRRKSPAVFLTGILLTCSSDFPCFPAGYGDFPAYSLEYPTGSGDWNVRPGLICTHTHTHTSTSLPIATHQQQQSNIECLIIDHPGTFQELSIIVSYALRVRSSKCTHAVNDTSNAPLVPLIKLENLINLSLHMYSVDFLDFERFIQRINSNLKN
ncbi:unnamed protein product [Rotaria magnacalcarata]|uniref:F-box domain-containing protein n=1 Tax=Rotaria magnacalcarata TaxID=392030 RepID=A0A814RQJ7_9BILA|nr:unnamed protein product [Rotaria magnacalcarata]CAF1629197.1 unnamed protein product [Rotaria magnacalcarata]CAF4289087.1 unnamed protein product [Rotaria magnacalcarata]CAF4417583.1 unnamed protein product [Rotaria magnacalcarata]